MGRQHALSGVVSGSLVAMAWGLSPAVAVPFVAITAVSSLLPDMDHPGAMLPRAMGWPGRMLAAIIHAAFGHRTLTHSVVGVGVLSAALAFTPHLPLFCYVAVILGCVTHIVGDMCTVSGVPVLWPMQRCYRIGRMRTGGDFERLVVSPLLFLAAAGSVGWLVATSA